MIVSVHHRTVNTVRIFISNLDKIDRTALAAKLSVSMGKTITPQLISMYLKSGFPEHFLLHLEKIEFNEVNSHRKKYTFKKEKPNGKTRSKRAAKVV